MDAFRQRMREHRYIEGQNFVLEYRSADGHTERYQALGLVIPETFLTRADEVIE